LLSNVNIKSDVVCTELISFFAVQIGGCKFYICKVNTVVMDFKLVSDFKPTGDQPQAIKKLVEGMNEGAHHQTLLGVTGSGKTFTMANVIAQEKHLPWQMLLHKQTDQP